MAKGLQQTLTEEEQLRRLLAGRPLVPGTSDVPYTGGSSGLYTPEELDQLKVEQALAPDLGLSSTTMRFVSRNPESKSLLMPTRPEDMPRLTAVAKDAPAPPPSEPRENETANILGQLLTRQAGVSPEDLAKIPRTLSLGSYSKRTTVTPGAYDPETGKRLAETYRQEQEAAERAAGITKAPLPSWVGRPGEVGPVADPAQEMGPPAPAPPPPPESELGIIAAKRAKTTEFAKTIDRWTKDNAAELTRAGDARDNRSKDLQIAERNLRSSEQAIAEAQIDPNRFWTGGIPGAGGVVFGAFKAIGHAVANAFGAYAQGMSRGAIPNTAVAMMEKAMDRDIDAQKANLQKLMLTRGFSKDNRDFISGEYDKAMAQRKALMLREQQLEVAKQGNEILDLDLAKEGVDVRKRIATSINELERKALLAEEAAKPRKQVSITSGGHQVLNPAYAAALKPEKPQKAEASVTEKLRANLGVMRDLNNLKDKYDLTGPSRFETLRNTNKDWTEFQRLQDLALFNYVKQQSGASFTMGEYNTRKAILDAATLTGFAGWKTAWGNIRRGATQDALRILQQYPQTSASLLPSDPKEMARDPFGANKPIAPPTSGAKKAE